MNETMMQNRMESAAGEPILEVKGLKNIFLLKEDCSTPLMMLIFRFKKETPWGWWVNPDAESPRWAVCF